MLYYEDPYLKSVRAKIIERRENKYLLDRTILYPGGGGQPPDRGIAICNGKEYQIVHNGDGWHEISGDCKDEVDIHLDWKWRFKMMRSHTAEHAFFRFLQNKGAVLGKANFGDVSSLIFTGEISIEDVLEAEEGVRNLIENNAEVRAFWIRKDEVENYPMLRIRPERIRGNMVRVVDIEGHDTTACKGIHVKNMAEIVDFAVISFRQGRRKEVKFVVSEEARDFHYKSSVSLRKLAWKNGVELSKIQRYVENIVDENKRMREALYSYSSTTEFESLNCGDIRFYFVTAPGADRKLMVRRIMELVREKNMVTLWMDSLNGTVAIAFSENLKIKDELMNLIHRSGGRGGGRGNFINAAVPNTNEFLESLKKVLCSGSILLHGGENGD